MPTQPSQHGAHDPAAQQRAAAYNVLYATIFTEVNPRTALARTIACETAARRLQDAGLLAALTDRRTPAHAA